MRSGWGSSGSANRGAANLAALANEEVRALCDVDARFLAAAAELHPEAARYVDFRRMLDEEELDGVVVSTPEHTHAVITMAALQAGLHVYCEKPLTHTVAEARAVAREAERRGRVTQMGTQIHAGENYQRVVELVRSGIVGEIEEVHAFSRMSYPGTGPARKGQPVPEHLDYDLWLGPVAPLPYHPDYLPETWRCYWPFGSGALGDMACHFVDLATWALELDPPTAVEAEGPPPDPFGAPDRLRVRYEMPARGGRPAVKLTWHDGGERPDERLEELGISAARNGVLFVGSKGSLVADYTRHMLLPADRFPEHPPLVELPRRDTEHHREWADACRTGGPTSCDFAYGARLTETVLLGAVAHRAGERLDWDSGAMRATGCEAADAFLATEAREGWAF